MVAGEPQIGEGLIAEGPVWIGRGAQIGSGVRLTGPIVIGDGAQVGDGAALRGSIIFPGTDVAAESILIGAIAGHGDILSSMQLPPALGAGAPRAAASKRSRRCCAASDSLSARMNSHTSAMPITSDCSTAMISPAIAWSEIAEMPHTRAWWA